AINGSGSYLKNTSTHPKGQVALLVSLPFDLIRLIAAFCLSLSLLSAWFPRNKGRKTMGIRFILMVNKQGQTRLAQYYEWLTLEERRAIEGEIVRKCLARNEQQCSFVEHRNYKIVYRRYASLFFLVGVGNDEEVDERHNDFGVNPVPCFFASMADFRKESCFMRE
ncbi:AP-4 complex subunit sigma, partial [Linum grandiflorum]